MLSWLRLHITVWLLWCCQCCLCCDIFWRISDLYQFKSHCYILFCFSWLSILHFMVISLVLVVLFIGPGLADFFPNAIRGECVNLVSWQVICDRLLVIQSWLCISDVVVSSILLCASWLVWLSVLLLLSSLLVSAICDLFLRSVPHVRLRLSELHLIHSVMPLLSSDRLILRFVPQAPFCDAAAEQSFDA